MIEYKTKRSTFIKVIDDEANIDKYKVAANRTEYHIISKFVFEESSFKNS